MIDSCMTSSLEKQIVFRASRVIQVLKFKFLRSIFWVLRLLTSCLSASKWRE